MPRNVKDIAIVELEMPRFENGRPLLIAGLGGRYTADTLDDLPALWDRFSIHLGNVRGQVGRAAYGACSDMFTGTGNFHYLAGAEVSDSSALPEEFSLVHIPAQRYVIFSHRKHVSRLRYTLNTIWSHWFPASDDQAVSSVPGNLSLHPSSWPTKSLTT